LQQTLSDNRAADREPKSSGSPNAINGSFRGALNLSWPVMPIAKGSKARSRRAAAWKKAAAARSVRSGPFRPPNHLADARSHQSHNLLCSFGCSHPNQLGSDRMDLWCQLDGWRLG